MMDEMEFIPLTQKTRVELVREYGEKNVTWAEEFVDADDLRDYQDEHYP